MTLPKFSLPYTPTIETSPHPDELRQIEQGLIRYNLFYAPKDGFQPLIIFIRDADQRLVGGLLGETYWG